MSDRTRFMPVFILTAASVYAGCGTSPAAPPPDASVSPPATDIRPVPHPDPVLLEYVAMPATIKLGERSVLQWRGEGFGTVQIIDGDYSYFLPLLGGSHLVEPTQTTTYTLSTHGLHGEGHAYQLTVEVRP